MKSIKLENKFLRLNNDANGNPRYYAGGLELACILGVNFSQLKANQWRLGLTPYKGKKYGFGFVFQSYNLAEDLRFYKERLSKILILEEKMPDFPIRVHCGRIEQKIGNRWKPYDDSVNNYFNDLNLDLIID